MIGVLFLDKNFGNRLIKLYTLEWFEEKETGFFRTFITANLPIHFCHVTA